MKKNKFISAVASVLLVIIVGVLNQKEQYNNHTNEPVVVKFKKCTDGDTAHFWINGVDETVRFIGIDTPETVNPETSIEPYGKEASDYTCSLIRTGKIELEYDENSQRRDKYGRVLAWVFVDKELLQLNLIKKGYAKLAYLHDDYKYLTQLKQAQETAKTKKLGIWNE